MNTIMMEIMEDTMKPFRILTRAPRGGTDCGVRIKVLRSVADHRQAGIRKQEYEQAQRRSRNVDG